MIDIQFMQNGFSLVSDLLCQYYQCNNTLYMLQPICLAPLEGWGGLSTMCFWDISGCIFISCNPRYLCHRPISSKGKYSSRTRGSGPRWREVSEISFICRRRVPLLTQCTGKCKDIWLCFIQDHVINICLFSMCLCRVLTCG